MSHTRKPASERRRFRRNHWELRGESLFRDGNWVVVPQAAIRAAILARAVRGAWVPLYPALDPVTLGDDVALEIIREARSATQRIARLRA